MLHQIAIAKFPNAFRAYPTAPFPTEEEVSRMPLTRTLIPGNIAEPGMRADVFKELMTYLDSDRPLFAKHDLAGWQTCFENDLARVQYWREVYDNHTDKRKSEAHKDRKVWVDCCARLHITTCYLREAMGLPPRENAWCPAFK